MSNRRQYWNTAGPNGGRGDITDLAGGGVAMSATHMPDGTKAAIVRAVLAEKYPKLALAPIAARFGITYDDLRRIIDTAGYPDPGKMRDAAAKLERQGAGTYDGHTTQVEPSAAAAADEQLLQVKVADLRADPDNLRDLPRLDDPGIIELADSIAEVGLLQPITVRRYGGDLIVVMGHRRLQALRRLKYTTTRVIVRGPMLPADVVAAMLVENGQRKDLNPIEEARGLRLLKTRDQLSDHELARKIGRSQPYVSTRLALLALSAEDQAAIVAGDMTLVEGTAKGRMNSGHVRPSGQDKNWHLGPNHHLALAAKARCHRLGHPKGRRVGGMACGECWESVIRADARTDFVDIAQRSGNCPICEQPVERQHEPIAVGR